MYSLTVSSKTSVTHERFSLVRRHKKYIITKLVISEVSLTIKLQIIYHEVKLFGGRNMNTREAIAARILQLCKEQGITPNGLSNISAVPQATIKSILNGESQNPGTVTIKKLCDGFDITLGKFFSTPEFDTLEQEIS